MALVSYAQNFEDVMLWRALGHIVQGRYIDIGAQDPVVDSVSLAFYERGWRGIHVEPMPAYAELIRQARPEDVVIQAAAAAKPGALKFFEFPSTGLSTLDPGIAAQHVAQGLERRATTVPAITLDEIFAANGGGEVHWLKIDVEGAEKQVLQGWSRAKARPWIVLIESTLPMTQVQSHPQWEALILRKGYKFAYFDGLNRFYIAAAHPELFPAFASGPNVFDEFALSGTASSSMGGVLNERVRFAEEKAEHAAREAEQRAARLQDVQSAALEAERSLGQALAAREREAAAQLHRERELGERLLAAQTEAARASRALSAREEAFGTQLRELSDRAAQGRADVARLTELEGHLKEQLSELQKKAARAEERHASAVHALEERHASLLKDLEERLRASREDAGQALRHLAAREREHDAEISVLREELAVLERRGAELAAAAKARERAQSLENRGLRERLAYLDQGRADLERRLSGLVQAEREATRQRQEALRWLQGELAALRQRRSSKLPAATAPKVLAVAAATNVEALLRCEDRQFVQCAYLTLLKRNPDPAGIEYYLGRLRAGVPKAAILGQLQRSREARAVRAQVAGLDRVVRLQRLARWPLIGGLIARLTGAEIETAEENHLRALEQRLVLLHDSAEADLKQLERNVAGLAQTHREIDGELAGIAAQGAAEPDPEAPVEIRARAARVEYRLLDALERRARGSR